MDNWYHTFYWLTVADGVKNLFDVTSSLFSWIAAINFIAISIFQLIVVAFDDAPPIRLPTPAEAAERKADLSRKREEYKQHLFRTFYVSLVLAIVTWLAYAFVPTKKDCLLIIAGGAVGNFIAKDSATKQIPSDISKFLHMSLQNQMADLSEDTKRELGVQSPKEKLLDKVKDLSKEELIEYLKSDTTLVR